MTRSCRKSSPFVSLTAQSFSVAELREISTDPAGASQAANADIDHAVQSALKKFNLPGATIAVLQDNQVIYAKGYGYSNLAQRKPARPEDRFEIGSISKSFTATAIMLLIEDRKLSLDDTVNKYFSDLPDSWRDHKNLATGTANPLAGSSPARS